jgi:salicylate hydroxylase
VQEVIDAAETIGKFATFDRDPLPRWSVGRVTLMGDAAQDWILVHDAERALD